MDTIRESGTPEACPTTTPVESAGRTTPTPLDEAAQWLQEAADAHPGLVLPPAAARALELVAESTFNPAAVAHALQADPALAVPALQKANGLLFTCRGDNLESALRRLGARGSRDVVLTVATLRSLRVTTDPQLGQWLRQRAEATALTASVIDLVLGSTRPDAYAAGLVHDLGWALGHAVLAEQPAESRPVLFADARLSREVVSRCHVALGTRVAAAWGLPGAVIDAVGEHHGSHVRGDSVAAVVRAALATINSLGVGSEGPAFEISALAALGLSGDAVAAVPTAAFGTLRRHGVVQDRRYDGGQTVGDRERRLLRYLGSA